MLDGRGSHAAATPAALRRPAGFLADWADPDRGDGRQRVARMAAEEHVGAPLVEKGSIWQAATVSSIQWL